MKNSCNKGTQHRNNSLQQKINTEGRSEDILTLIVSNDKDDKTQIATFAKFFKGTEGRDNSQPEFH
jgi:hypothetical protein